MPWSPPESSSGRGARDISPIAAPAAATGRCDFFLPVVLHGRRGPSLVDWVGPEAGCVVVPLAGTEHRVHQILVLSAIVFGVAGLAISAGRGPADR
jgi:hypothetical protein